MRQTLRTIITSVSLILVGVFISATLASMPHMKKTISQDIFTFNQQDANIVINEPAIKSIIKLKNVQFEKDTAIIKDGSFSRLQVTALALKKHSSISVMVASHSNNIGNDKINHVLTTKRALVIKNYLIAQGVSAKQLSYKGYGASLPIANNNTHAGRKNNERMELRIY